MNSDIVSTATAPIAIEDSFRIRVTTRTARVGVIGMGYVGLPLALLFSEQHFHVTGFDIDPRKIETLRAGGSYIYRIPHTDIEAARGRGFSATVDYAHIAEMDAVIICVPTPLSESREPDLTAICQTAQALAPNIREGQLIVLESTTYPGTTEEVLVPILEKGSALKAARGNSGADGHFYVAFSPEREDPGNDTVARRDIPKVIGGLNATAAEFAAELYGSIFNQTVRVSTPAAAEMTKLLENIYRCVNIALVNELKLLAMRMGIDIWEVIEAAKTKPFGFHAFYPGPGLGGHCIPVDPFYLAWKARQFDFQTHFIELAGEVNASMPYHVVASLIDALNQRKKTLNGARVLVLGVAYKKDVDDLRESPSLTVIELLRNQGADVRYHDPFFLHIGRGRKYNLQMDRASLDRLDQYDCVLIITDHSDYDYAKIVKDSQLVVDTRNATKGITSEKIVRC
jgi:UDP-N-acetyl-D-glucosamine dehydrogenase